MSNIYKKNTVSEVILSDEQVLVKNLRRLMRDQSINEAGLARMSCVPQPTLHKILSGKTDNPRVATIKMLAAFFNVSMDGLYKLQPEVGYQRPSVAAQSVPIVNWRDCLKGYEYVSELNANNWPDWVVTDVLHKYVYALRSKPSLEPKFIRNSLLIVNENEQLSDGDIVVVHYSGAIEATLRELLMDGPDKQLLPVNNDTSKAEVYNDKIKILGAVSQVRFDF